MVDPNPGRGMPAALQRYWLVGKGAAKIRWNVPGDFLRCVRQLRKHFPKNPKGLCNILHTKATGGPPGHGSAEHSLIASDWVITAASKALMDVQPHLGPDLWAGPIAPIGRPTGEPRNIRLFEPGALQHRSLPLPLDHRRVAVPGHTGSVTVGRILGITYGPDENGMDWAWGWGDWLDEDLIPEVKTAKYLVAKGVAGPSLDPGGRISATVNPETGAEHMLSYTIGGATLVSIPAFAEMRLHTFSEDGDWPDDDLDMVMALEGDEDDCGCGGSDSPMAMVAPVAPKHLPMAVGASPLYSVNAGGWRGLPLAARESVFDNDDAVKRIAAWANWSAQGADVERLKRAFMWYDETLPPTDPTSYRLPVGDIINGKLTLIFHAIYAAAALISGAHGGLPGIPDPAKNELRNIITDIYKEMAVAFNDRNVRAPWDRPENEGQQFAMDDTQYPVEPPGAWFDNPNLTTKTPLTVDDDGRVYGHLAAWNECHRDVSQRACVLAPHSKLDYKPFHLGQVRTAEGERIKVGKIVQDTRHAGINLGYMAAAIHYDDTGDEVALVRAGEDQFGIWVAGAVVPEATPRKVAKLRRSPLSGDWRAVEGNLELTAALAVNVPAFPVYAMEGEDRLALVAAGTVFHDVDDEPIVEDDGIDRIVAIFTAMSEELKNVDTEPEVDEQEDRVQRFEEMLEDEDIYAQRERTKRLDSLRAAAGDPAYAPPAPAPVAPAAAPAPSAPAAPATDAAPVPVDPTAVAIDPAMEVEQRNLAMQMNGRFSVVRRPDGSVPTAGTTPAQVPAEATVAPVAPAAPVPVAAAPAKE